MKTAETELELLRKSKAIVGTRYSDRAGWLRFSTNLVSIDGLWLEFGVFNGGSLETIAKQTSQPVFGFDSFEGLPTAWTTDGKTREKGLWSRNGNIPKLTAPNAKLVVGWFDKTLPEFLHAHPQPCALIHIDCDVYESTKIILNGLKDRIVAGTVICFDDIHGYVEYAEGEMKAWLELLQEKPFEYEWVAHERPKCAAVLRIIK